MSDNVGATASPQPALALRATPASGRDASRFDQAQHTPGPWRITHKGFLGVGILPSTGELRTEAGPIITAWSAGLGTGEAEANARLIAAAPELLALAYQYADDLRYPPTADSKERRLAAVEAVLAKVQA